MPTSDYYRRQAETCLKLALAVGESSGEVATYLQALAQEFMVKAATTRPKLEFGAVGGRAVRLGEGPNRGVPRDR